METELSNHRKGAYLYGFMSGIGATMLTWSVILVLGSSAANLPAFIALTLFGVTLFAYGSCREAYLRGILAVPSAAVASQNQEPLAATNTQEPVLANTQEPILVEPEQHNQA